MDNGFKVKLSGTEKVLPDLTKLDEFIIANKRAIKDDILIVVPRNMPGTKFSELAEVLRANKLNKFSLVQSEE